MYFLQAFKPIALDLLATIVFAGTYWATGNIILATIAGVVIGAARFGWLKLRNQPVGPLQYLSVVLVIVSGVTTVLTKDPFFVQIKSSVIAVAVGIVMLRTNWMAPYLPAIVKDNLEPKYVLWASRFWGILEIVMAAINAAVALTLSFNAWALYTSFVPGTVLVAAFALQYAVFRTLIRRNIIAKMAAAQGAAPA
jgi:intracellular septation protein